MLKTGNFSFLEITGFRSIKYKTDLEFGFCDLDLPLEPLETSTVPINCQFENLKLPVFKPVPLPVEWSENYRMIIRARPDPSRKF